MNEPSGERGSVPFSRCILTCFKDFVRARENPAEVWVITSLRSGQKFGSLGIEIKSATDAPGCVLIQGRDQTPRAIVVREDDIAGVEFQVMARTNEEGPAPFGFYPRST